MFSTGQLIFAGLFVVVFTYVIIRVYRKDGKLHAANYKGAKWVGIFFIIFIMILFFIKYMLKN